MSCIIMASEDSIKRTLDILQQMGMTRFASAVMFVMQKVFGLKDNYLILPPDIKEGRFLLSEIIVVPVISANSTNASGVLHG